MITLVLGHGFHEQLINDHNFTPMQKVSLFNFTHDTNETKNKVDKNIMYKSILQSHRLESNCRNRDMSMLDKQTLKVICDGILGALSNKINTTKLSALVGVVPPTPPPPTPRRKINMRLKKFLHRQL